MLVIGQFVVRHLIPCTVTGLEHYSAAPATLVVSNHRRDADGPLLGSVLLRRRGLRPQAPLPNFVAREDLFEQGFLAHYLPRWPAAVRSTLAGIRLRRFLMQCGTWPLQRTHEQNVAEVLQDLLDSVGDMPITQAMRPSRLQSLARVAAFDADTTRISELVRSHNNRLWRTRYGYRHLRLAIFRRIKPQLQHRVEQQLDHFAALLDNGHMVILEPEGRLSLDGRLRRPRAALHELVNRPRRPVRVLPIAVTYDALTTGKARVFVDILPEMIDVKALDRRTLDARVMRTIRAGCRVTGGQLAISFLLRTPTDENWSQTALANALFHSAQACRSAGLSLDPCLLQRDGCRRRARTFVHWGLAAKLLRHEQDGTYRLDNCAMPPPWLPDGPVTLLEYLRAELEDTVGADRVRELELLP